MKSIARNRRSFRQSQRIGCFPFICVNIPLVGIEKSSIGPYVGFYRPSVRCVPAFGGFTIVELLLALVVAGVLFAVAIPSLRSIIQNSRMTTQSNEIVADLALARSEAIKLNQNVVVCHSANPTAVTPSCSGGGTWESGWIIFMDNAPPDNSFSTASGDFLIRTHDALAGGNTMRASDAALNDMVIFTSSGVVKPGTVPSQSYFKICDTRGADKARAVVFETTGRTHIARQSSLAALSCP